MFRLYDTKNLQVRNEQKKNKNLENQEFMHSRFLLHLEYSNYISMYTFIQHAYDPSLQDIIHFHTQDYYFSKQAKHYGIHKIWT